MSQELGSFAPPDELQSTKGYSVANTLEEPRIDPIGQWEQIKQLHGKEGQQALQAFRESLYQNKERIAQYQAQIIDFIHQYSELDVNDQLSYALTLAQTSGFSGELLELVIDVLAQYAELHDQVEKWLADYPEGSDLYKAVFQREPAGKVEVVKGPMTILLRCYDLDDFAYVEFDGWTGSSAVITAEMRLASMHISGISLEEFDGIFLLENASLLRSDEESQKTLVHEEQHAIARLFSETTRSVETEKAADIILEKLGGADIDERDGLLRDYFRLHRQMVDERVSDEILANVVEGVPGWQDLAGLFTVKGGVYDYIGRQQLRLQRLKDEVALVLGEDNRHLVEAAYTKVFEAEYLDTIKWSANAVAELDYYGYSPGEIIGLLLHVPLRSWAEVVDKVISQGQAEKPQAAAA